MQFGYAAICLASSALTAFGHEPAARESVTRNQQPASQFLVEREVEPLIAHMQAETQRHTGAMTTLAALEGEMRTTLSGGGALALGPSASFLAFADASVAYQGLYQDYVRKLTFELAHTKSPLFPVAELARSTVFETLGSGYSLTESWAATPLVAGAPTPNVITRDGATGTQQLLQVFSNTVPGFVSSGAPDFVQLALAPYITPVANGYFYSASFNNSVANAGQAVAIVDNGLPLLVYMPDTVTDATSLFPASLVAYARSLDASFGLDWGGLMQLLRPAFTPPTWGGSGGSNGVWSPIAAQGGGCAGVEECLAAAEAAYNTQLLSAYDAYSQAVDAAWLDFESDAEANRQSRDGFFDAFSRAGWPDQLGSTYEAWWEYVNGFDEANRAELNTDLENAEKNLKAAVCAAGKDFADAVKDCVRDCPEWAGLGDAMDAWLANQGC